MRHWSSRTCASFVSGNRSCAARYGVAVPRFRKMSSGRAWSCSAPYGRQRISMGPSHVLGGRRRRSSCFLNGASPYASFPRFPTSVGKATLDDPVTLDQFVGADTSGTYVAASAPSVVNACWTATIQSSSDAAVAIAKRRGANQGEATSTFVNGPLLTSRFGGQHE